MQLGPIRVPHPAPLVWRSLLVLALSASAFDSFGDDKRDFQVPLGVPDVTRIADRIEERALSIMRFVACGEEAKLLGMLELQAQQPDDFQPGEDLGTLLIAKSEFLRRNASFVAIGDAQWQAADCNADSSFEINSDAHDAPINRGVAILKTNSEAIPRLFGDDCNGAKVMVTEDIAQNRVVRVNFKASVPGKCLRRQINYALANWKHNAQLGTDKEPCRLGLAGSTHGDWDVVVRDLLRVYFIDRSAQARLLDAPNRATLINDLVSVSGKPMPAESYSLFECGNVEKTQGTPEEIAADQGDKPLFEDVADDLWPGVKWLLWRLVLIFAVATVVGALGVAVVTYGVATAAAAGLVAGAVVIVGTLLSIGRIPETENHLLMIETSRFLKNKVLIEYYTSHGMDSDAAAFERHQDAIRGWLVTRIQGFMKEDFEEYNARPYQRFSLLAMMNLVDFSDDQILANGARMVLDRQLTKMIVSSSEGRRFVPFRRQMHRLALFDSTDGTHVAALTESDFPSTLALAYVGHTEHLPQNSAHGAAAGELVYPLASSYRPPDMLVALALQQPDGLRADGTDGIWQHSVRHASNERYVRGRHFTLIAGGKQSGLANKFELVGIPTAGLDPNDRGAAFPITLLIDAGDPQSNGHGVRHDQLRQFLQILGDRIDYTYEGDHFWTYDGNMCVWKGFACGKDIRLPADMKSCLVDGPPHVGATWRFIDSDACVSSSDGQPPVAMYGSAHRVFVAILTQGVGPAEADGDRLKLGNGFFEVVDAVDAGNDFGAFRARLVAANPNVAPPRGVYVSARGETIRFELFNSKKGIETVNGVEQPDLVDWAPGLQGSLVSTSASGVMIVENTDAKQRLFLDSRSMQYNIQAIP